MSAPVASLNADDDGPEEGEIEDDDDDIIFLEGNSQAPAPTHRYPRSSSSTTSTKAHQVRGSAASKECYERDIRNFELRKNRTARSSRASGGTKSPHSSRKEDTRTKSKYSRTGLTQGKENRHAHRHRSPSYRHRNGSHDRALADCKDVSPLRIDSSCSSDESVDQEIRSPAGRSSRTHHRLTPSSRPTKCKRKGSSSPDSAHNPAKRKSHHSEKCPLMKVLRSVARETRLINNSMETSETTLESSSSLRQRLLNMGAMSEVSEEQTSVNGNLMSQPSSNCTKINENEEKIEETIPKEDSKKPVLSQTIPIIEILEDSNNLNNCKPISEQKFTSPSKTGIVENVISPVSSASSVKVMECIEDDSLLKHSESANIACSSPLICENHDDDDDDDISQLRLLALQSKKHEPAPMDDADVLQLRLAALKTAFMKKFKTRKKNTLGSVAILSKEDPLSSIDVVPLSPSPESPDEATTPVDMELAETDDEATSEHSMDCYSPSDPIHEYFPPDPNPEHLSLFSFSEPYSPSRPTGSPTREPSLQELLPPPPPPDLDLYLSEPEPNPESSPQEFQVDNSIDGYFLNYTPSAAILEPPPLPSYFRDLLSGFPDVPNTPLQDRDSSNNLREINLVPCSSSESETSLIQQTSTVNDCSCQNAPSNLLKCEDISMHKQIASEPTDPGSIVAVVNAAEIASKSVCQSEQKESSEISVNLSSKAEIKPPAVPLEEEEKMLRQRLLFNMANKKNNALMNRNMTKDQPSLSKKQPQEIAGEIPSSTCKGIVPDVTKKRKAEETKSNLKTAPVPQLAKSKPALQVLSVPSPTDENRLIINLGEDSDSCEDYSEAEALGTTCAKNRAKWLLHMKELEVNLPKTLGSSVKTASVVGTKMPARENVKSRQPVKESTQLKPFAENLADLENSVEQFLKGVRKSHEAVSKTKQGLTAVSSATPVAVKHLPPKQQEEYRQLKHRIATLERQRQMSVQPQKKNILSSEEQQNTSSFGGQTPKKTTPLLKELPKKSNTNLVEKLKKISTLSEEQPKKITPISIVKLKKNVSVSVVQSKKTLALPKGTLKTAPNGSGSSQQEMSVSSSRATSSNNQPNVQRISAHTLETSKIDKKVSALSSSQANYVSSVKMLTNASTNHKDSSRNKVQENDNAAKGVKPVGIILGPNAASALNLKKTVNVPSQPKLTETDNAADVEPQTHVSLLNLETTVIRERSNVLNELSALSKLLSQVEKSIVAQSNTATEVSSLLDKLCLAAGRWKAQDKTVTGLVQRVAQRQKELSLRHQSCIDASTSCVELGLSLNKGSYRVPMDKADTMRLQLKHVHEKTQDLAKRRTAERARKTVLEKRAQDCLCKLFNDSKRVSAANESNLKLNAQGNASHPKITPKEGKLEAISTPKSPVNEPALTPSSEFSTKLPKHQSLANQSVSSSETHSGTSQILNTSPKVITGMVGGALSNRLVLNKVKSAKAVLNLSLTKQMQKKVKKGHSKRKHLSRQTNEDCEHYLSDMEISTDDEETDVIGKCVTGNTDVVDMSVSPDTSLSPLDIEREAMELLSHSNDQDGRTQKVSTDAGIENTSKGQKFLVPLKVSIPPKESNGDQSLCCKPSRKGVLKDYVSPLSGLSVFSNSVKGEVKEGDLYAILCPYDLNGKCEDSECAFKHQNGSLNRK